MLRLVSAFYGQGVSWNGLSILGNLLLLLGAVSLLVGVFGALYQVKIRRLIAYSSIANIGYVFIALGVGGLETSIAIAFYLVIYVFLVLNTFAILISIRRAEDKASLVFISELKPVARSLPLLGFALAFNMFSIAGVPPLAGFFSKFILLYSIYSFGGALLALFIVLVSAVSAIYYIRVVKVLFFDKTDALLFNSVGGSLSYLVAITTILNVGLICFIDLVYFALSSIV